MEKQYAPSDKEKKIAKKMEAVTVQQPESVVKSEEIKNTEVKESIKEEKKEAKEEKKEGKKSKKEEKKAPKEMAIVNGKSLRISYKYSGEVCRMIMGKTPEDAIARMNEVLKGKRAVPMQRRETAHQRGRGISGGKFPINVCRAMIDLVKQVQANASHNGIENPVIVKAMANKASAPYRSGGRRGKRAHVYIEVRDKIKLMEKK
jgi:ribosomal protein L22